MKVIHKYELKIGITEVEIPISNRILSIQIQDNKVCMWILLDDSNNTKVKRKFVAIGTGHSINEENKLVYLDTIQLNKGTYIFHIFEQLN